MKKIIELKTIEAHTCGEPARIIVEGMPQIKGNTMLEKQQYMKENLDQFRTAITAEPRGHRDMFSAVITDPCSQEADFGAIFFSSGFYENMSVHAMICICTAAVNERWLNVKEPETVIKVDTCSGMITVHVEVSGGRAGKVTMRNVPAFIYSENQVVHTDAFGDITGDVIYGGASLFQIDADKLGIPIDPEHSEDLIDIAMDVLGHKDELEFRHPELPIDTVDYILFHSANTKSPDSVGINCIMLGERRLDRSPSGTTGRTGYLYLKGKIGLNETTIHENLLGMTYTGTAVEETTVGDFPAVVAEISGRAYITGRCDFIIDEDDPMGYGFRLK
ncbi:MAG: proline racemase family protein [Firmicutes bacterium]|nr:proline racemase family protein [Bacillota bacterium]